MPLHPIFPQYIHELSTSQEHGHFLVEFFALEYMLNVANGPILAVQKVQKPFFGKIPRKKPAKFFFHI
jgi:hypothetical protein